MADYKALYHKLYNRITDVIAELQQVQQEAETLYTEACDTEITMLESKNETDNSAGCQNP